MKLMESASVMNAAVELHDSEVVSVVDSAGTTRILLRAIVHTSIGEPGVSSGDVWTQLVALSIQDCRASGVLQAGAQIVDGSLEVGGVRYENVVPIQLDSHLALRLDLDAGDDQVRLQGSGIRIEAEGPRRKLGTFP